MRAVLAAIVVGSIILGLVGLTGVAPAAAGVVASATRIEVGGEPHEIVVDASGNRAWVSVPEEDRVVEIDTEQLAVVGGFDVTAPYGIDLSLDGQEIYAAMRGETGFARYDRATHLVSDVTVPELGDSRTFDVFEAMPRMLLLTADPSSSGPAYVVAHDLATGESKVVAGGTQVQSKPAILGDRSSVAYVSNGFSPNSLYKLDLTTPGAPIVAEDRHGEVHFTNGSALSPDGRYVVTARGEILDTSSEWLVPRGSVTEGFPVISQDSARIYTADMPDGRVQIVSHDAATSLATHTWTAAGCGYLPWLTDVVAGSEEGVFLVAGRDAVCVVDVRLDGSLPPPSTTLLPLPSTSVVDTEGVRATAIDLGGDAFEASVAAGGDVWISVPDRDRVHRLDGDTLTITGGFDVAGPMGIDAGVSGEHVFVALDGSTGFGTYDVATGMLAQTVIPELGTPDTFDVYEARPGQLLLVSNIGFSYPVRHDLQTGRSEVVASGHPIFLRPVIVGDRADVAYVSERFGMEPLFQLDLSESGWPVTAENGQPELGDSWATAVAPDGSVLVTGSGQILDPTTEDLAVVGELHAGIPVVSADSETIFIATSTDGVIEISTYSASTHDLLDAWSADCGSIGGLIDFVAIEDGAVFLVLVDESACVIDNRQPPASTTTSQVLDSWTTTSPVEEPVTTTTIAHSSTTTLPEPTGEPEPQSDSPQDRFIDDDSSIFEREIEAIAEAGITAGCTADRFCPDDPVTRGQMAAFLVRALRLPEVETSDRFSDTQSSVFAEDIERLARAGITTGCDSTRFCPESVVTRGQMAAFLVRALGLTDRSAEVAFRDTGASTFEADIARLATARITTGCAADRFCPESVVTRGQMAAFLTRALELPTRA